MIHIIVACDEKRCIGPQGILPWRIPGEQLQFQDLTMGGVVLMGRKSYQEIGTALPGREVLVLTNSMEIREESVRSVHSFQDAITIAGERDLYIVGGEAVYGEALDLADSIYLTRVHKTYAGDTFFPEIAEELYDVSELESGDEYTRYLYRRKKRDLLLTVEDGRDSSELTQVIRYAVRGVIQKDNQYLLIRSRRYGEYKFPGGGMEAGESRVQTLIREVEEETGRIPVASTIAYLGRVEEHRRGIQQDFFNMTSYYYRCQTQEQYGNQSLVDYEIEYGYEPVYIELEKAIASNEELGDTDHIPWVDRDTAVMRYLLLEESEKKI